MHVAKQVLCDGIVSTRRKIAVRGEIIHSVRRALAAGRSYCSDCPQNQDTWSSELGPGRCFSLFVFRVSTSAPRSVFLCFRVSSSARGVCVTVFPCFRLGRPCVSVVLPRQKLFFAIFLAALRAAWKSTDVFCVSCFHSPNMWLGYKHLSQPLHVLRGSPTVFLLRQHGNTVFRVSGFEQCAETQCFVFPDLGVETPSGAD